MTNKIILTGPEASVFFLKPFVSDKGAIFDRPYIQLPEDNTLSVLDHLVVQGATVTLKNLVFFSRLPTLEVNNGGTITLSEDIGNGQHDGMVTYGPIGGKIMILADSHSINNSNITITGIDAEQSRNLYRRKEVLKGVNLLQSITDNNSSNMLTGSDIIIGEKSNMIFSRDSVFGQKIAQVTIGAGGHLEFFHYEGGDNFTITAPDDLWEPVKLSNLYLATSLYKYLAPKLLQEGTLSERLSPSPLLLKLYYAGSQHINAIMFLKENIQPGIMKGYILDNFFTLAGIGKSLEGSELQKLPQHLRHKILSFLDYQDIGHSAATNIENTNSNLKIFSFLDYQDIGHSATTNIENTNANLIEIVGFTPDEGDILHA